jgi:type VI secretion system protein ImpA
MIMNIPLSMVELLAPFSEDAPSGEDMRYSEVYDRIKEARRADDILEQGEWQTELKSSDWRQVIESCRKALSKKTKDLQLCAWLTEALLHHHDFKGLAFGLELTSSLLRDFWDTLYPPAEDGDLDYRIGPLTFMNEKLALAVCQVPICDPSSTKGYNYHQWEESRLVGVNQNLDKAQQERRQSMIEEGKITGENFSTAVNASSISFYEPLTQSLKECRQRLADLESIVNERFLKDAPGFTQLSEAIEGCLHLVERIYRDKQKSEVVRNEDMENEDVKDKTEHMDSFPENDEEDTFHTDRDDLLCRQSAISDVTLPEKGLWNTVARKLQKGQLKNGLNQLISAAALSPSPREKNRHLLLVAKLCLKAERPDLAKPIVEELYTTIETLQLEQWEHPAWIADVVETLYRCLVANDSNESDRARGLFQKLCRLNVTKAAAYRMTA